MNKKLQLIVLPIICLILGIALAGVYNLTAPTIEEVEKKSADRARKEVLINADGFKQINTTDIPENLNVIEAHKSTNGVGGTFKVVTSGYGGEISLMIGVNSDGTVAGVKILSHSETPGLGAKTASPEFLQEFVGKSPELKVVKNNPTSDKDIVAISSATTSSKAVTKAVNDALTAFSHVKEEM